MMRRIPKVTTAIVPVGGYGTRFLPASKSVPKEMFPLIDKPVVYYVVEELVKSGITKIIFVVGHRKQSVEDFFSRDESYDEFLTAHGKRTLVKKLQKISDMAHFSFVYTAPPYGNGAALHAARHEIAEGEPFVLVWGDEIVWTPRIPRVKRCIDTFRKFGHPTISAFHIEDPKARQHYGMADGFTFRGQKDVLHIEQIVEKPRPGKEPTEFAAHGAYVLPYRAFSALDEVGPGKDGELWLTDIVNAIAKKEPVLGCIIRDGEYLDCGTPEAYLRSSILFALHSPYGPSLEKFLRDRLEG